MATFMGVKRRRASSGEKHFKGDYLDLTNNKEVQKTMQKCGESLLQHLDA